MGYQHPGENGQWPHLDALWADSNIDSSPSTITLPLTDWTTGGGGLDVAELAPPAPSGSWPPSAGTMNGLGLSGAPSIYSPAYLKANIEGGPILQLVLQRRRRTPGRGLDPNGSALDGVAFPRRRSAGAGAQPLLLRDRKSLRRSNCAGGGTTRTRPSTTRARAGLPQGPRPNGRSAVEVDRHARIRLFASVDKATNQPNVFFDPKSSESATPFWSIWDPAPGLSYLPRRDDTIAARRAAGDLRLLEHGRPQRGERRRPADAAMGVLLRLELGRAAVPVFPVARLGLGRHGRLAGGRLGERASPAAAARRADAAAVAGDLSDARPRKHRLVGSRPAEVRNRRSRIMLSRPLDAPAALARTASYDLELTYEVLRSDGRRTRIAGDRRLLRAGMPARPLPFWVAPPGLSAVAGRRWGSGTGQRRSFRSCNRSAATASRSQGVSSVSAIYLDGVAQTSGWTVSSGYAPVDHLHDCAGRRRRRDGRFRSALALPVRRGRAGFRGVHGDALYSEDAAAFDGATVTAPPELSDPRRPRLELAQATDILDCRGEPRLGPRGAEPALPEPDLAI